jgi:hypothetical protein
MTHFDNLMRCQRCSKEWRCDTPEPYENCTSGGRTIESIAEFNSIYRDGYRNL